MITLEFQSTLNDHSSNVWEWLISAQGINNELFPFIYMTGLNSLQKLNKNNITLNVPIGNSWLLLFGFLPIDRSKLTLIDIVEGEFFIEESPMFSMKHWHHKRKVKSLENKCILLDTLIFKPRFFPVLISFFVKILFKNRHKNLVRYFGQG